MNTLQVLLDSAFVHRLGWTLVHFVWQGIAVGLVYLCARHMLKGKSPRARYHLALGTLAALAALPVITFIHLAGDAVGQDPQLAAHMLSVVGASHAQHAAGVSPGASALLGPWLQRLIPWAVPIWLLGVSVATIRVFRSWHHAYGIRKTASFVYLQEWQSKIETLCRQFGISKAVRLAVSTGVAVPSVIGWLKPVILIPPSSIAGLTPEQMELILAHELAHICRQDYFWNLLQVVVETLLFYHPVVGWISRQARMERELCCDDMVVGLRGNAVAYARALTELESLRHPHKALLLGADGGQIFNRIHRLLGLRTQDAPVFWLPLLIISALLLAATLTQITRQQPVLQPLLAAKYGLLGNTAVPHTPALVQPPAPPMVAPHVPIAALQQPHTLTAIHMPAAQRLQHAPISAPTAPLLAPAPAVVAAAAVKTQNNYQHMAASVIETHAPVYPVFALERGVEGSATVAFTLTPEGKITDMRVTHISGSILFGNASMDALRQWKFAPASAAGVPVAQRMVEEFVYRLRNHSQNDGVCNIPMGYHVCIPD
ncbi:MAG: M56 family metallopeptidase [Gammaproteobacteria bacterium]|nr:M56 family metallopeptidase [Gammaproteobacteria bacterium]